MGITSSSHWSRAAFSPEEREVAAVFLDDMRVQDPESPTFGYYDPKSQIAILTDAAMNEWQPAISPTVAARAGMLAMMVRDSELSPAGH